jgi:hypothetical protein
VTQSASGQACRPARPWAGGTPGRGSPPAEEVDGGRPLPQRAQQVLEEGGPLVGVLLPRQRHHRLGHLVAQEGRQRCRARRSTRLDQRGAQRHVRLGGQPAAAAARQLAERLGAPEAHLHIRAGLEAGQAELPAVGRGAHGVQVRRRLRLHPSVHAPRLVKGDQDGLLKVIHADQTRRRRSRIGGPACDARTKSRGGSLPQMLGQQPRGWRWPASAGCVSSLQVGAGEE